MGHRLCLRHLPRHMISVFMVGTKKGIAQMALSKLTRSRGAKQRVTALAAKEIVNQLTGFSLSNYHLSTEVHEDGWAFLNPQSKRLDKASLKRIADGSIIYVNTKETELFVRDYLPHLRSDFVLISSQLWSPPQPSGSVVDTVLSHEGLLAWFSPNREDDDLPIRPFPAGVALRGISNILAAIKKHKSTPRADAIYVPHSAVHDHLSEVPALTRKGLQPFMAKPIRHQDYLEQLAKHRFVVSPAGDRPDTYRHWESIAMGAIPVSSLPKPFEELFGDSAILVDDLVASVNGPFESTRAESDRTLASVDYWRRVVDKSTTRN